MIRFIDRIEEIKVLEKDWRSKKNEFIVVFGRRRIGKTTLLNEFVKNKEGIKYTAEDVNKAVQIVQFKDIIAKYLKDDFLLKQHISDWSSLFDYLAKVLSKEKRIYIWIDELSYVIKNDSSVTSVLQKFNDEFLRESRIFFITSGSLFGLMSEKVLSSSSPLYGRRTRDILLAPIPIGFVNEFLSFHFEDLIKTFLTINGIPEYLNIASKHKAYSEFVSEEFLKPEGYFFREPVYLLAQEFKEIKTYFSIINAIAYGSSRPSGIANFVGIQAREIYPYLELLINYGFISRQTSMLGDRKRGIYYIRDNFFDFWFNIVHKNRESIEKREYKINNDELNSYLGKRFEMLIRENFLSFFKNFEDNGKWWYKDKEIDILAVNNKEKSILFGECKWQEKVNVFEIVKMLLEKSKYIAWNNDERKESFVVFAKSFTKKIKEFEGKKVYCFDLKDMEDILEKR